MSFWNRLFGRSVEVRDISHSKLNVVAFFRKPKYKVSLEHLKAIHNRNFDEEIRAKFIPKLHQDNDFERNELVDVLAFERWITIGHNKIFHLYGAFDTFNREYQRFTGALKKIDARLLDAKNPYVKWPEALYEALPSIAKRLKKLSEILSSKSYKILSFHVQIQRIPINISKDLNKMERRGILSLARNQLSYDELIMPMVDAYTIVLTQIDGLNQWIDEFHVQRSAKIIAGDAGTGKTHLSTFLVQELEKAGHIVLFFKPRQFTGDDVNLEEKLMELMDVPHGIRMNEVLNRMNKLAAKNGVRLFFIIDALNETTTSTLGFSDIWKVHLQQYINKIAQYPNLYLIATLRTSYITSVWDLRPRTIAELRGFTNKEDIQLACKKYFEHYNIKAVNKEDFPPFFRIPLLLDLFCKICNEEGKKEVEITITMQSYLEVFEGYVAKLIEEVRIKRGLAAETTILSGMEACADKFLQNTEAVLTVPEFVSCFDHDPNTQERHSIARSVLEGYLLFIRDKWNKNREIIKHTQQEIGGYLLATELMRRYKTADDLLASADFNEKIIGADPHNQHQLRLDILKFLIALNPDIIRKLNGSDEIKLAWWYLFNSGAAIPTETYNYVKSHQTNISSFEAIMNAGRDKWFTLKPESNFFVVYDILFSLSTWEIDLTWGFFIYNNARDFYNLIDNAIAAHRKREMSDDMTFVFAKFAAMVTSTNIRELRDRATLYLINFGGTAPLALLQIAEEVCRLNDSYVYERVIHALYGVSLRKQHNKQFVNEILPRIADVIFSLQFAVEAKHPVFNYIIIDSIKHILDLSLKLGVWNAPERDIKHIQEYFTPALPEWIPPSAADRNKIGSSPEMSPPEPFRMDFVIYTIPRLIKGHDKKTDTTANVYKRIWELGFVDLEHLEIRDERFNSYHSGVSLTRMAGKVDRLGKKYAWKGFFDFAGILLQRGVLNVFENFESGKKYERLGDVEIDISVPNAKHKLQDRFYFDELIPAEKRIDSWQLEVKIETIEPHLLKEFDGVDYVMLKGVVEQRVGEEYDVRSFIMAETCFIEKNDSLQRLKDEVCSEVFDWDRDLHLSPSYESGTYFGELYWADNQVENAIEHYSVKTGKKVKASRVVTYHDHFADPENFGRDDIGKMREFSFDELLSFAGEATLVQYLNESDSESFKGFSMYIPATKMGMQLGLKADPARGSILDAELKPCLITVDYGVDLIKNEATYMRADLLKNYMEKHNYALLYQTKQHSYDKTGEHNRSMKYQVIEL